MILKYRKPQFKNGNRQMFLKSSFFVLLLILFSTFSAKEINAAQLLLSPSAGTFEVGSTFEVGVYLNTQGETINAIEILLSFPANKLQLVSPSIGQSIVGIWTNAPQYDNKNGTISLQGAIPGGVNTSKGLITKLAFRVKSVGPATIRFLDQSKTLLHDGKGTNVLQNIVSGVYTLALPPPAGPIVSSKTHPDPSIWYSNPNVVFQWTEDSEPDGYSYVLSDSPGDQADDIMDDNKDSVLYSNVSDGIHFFHIKSIKDGRWGGSSHFAVQIDVQPPSEFPLKILPSNRTTQRKPIAEFLTTDSGSGIDYYELKIIPLQGQVDTKLSDQPLFIEVQSPYILPELEIGTYNVVVRAHDKAGNYQDSVTHLSIINPVFEMIKGEGIKIGDRFVIRWVWFWAFALILVAILGFISWRVQKWHKFIRSKQNQGELPDYIKEKLEELKQYRDKYGPKTFTILLFLIMGLSIFFSTSQAFADQIDLDPPIITSVSQSISNEEIFYAIGKTEIAQAKVIVYLQNTQTGSTNNYSVVSDNNGDWFYRHDGFLSSGKYIVWAQTAMDNQLSPPTPQHEITVYPIALQFGVSRISFAELYLTMIIVLFVIVSGLIWYITFHALQGRRRHHLFMKEVKEAENSVKRGFAILKRDIQTELDFVEKAKLTKQLSKEEEKISQQLLKDLERIEDYIGKEVWDVERADYDH